MVPLWVAFALYGSVFLLVIVGIVAVPMVLDRHSPRAHGRHTTHELAPRQPETDHLSTCEMKDLKSLLLERRTKQYLHGRSIRPESRRGHEE